MTYAHFEPVGSLPCGRRCAALWLTEAASGLGVWKRCRSGWGAMPRARSLWMSMGCAAHRQDSDRMKGELRSRIKNVNFVIC